MVHSPTAHWSDRAFCVLFPLRVYPYCTIKLRFNREQEQKRTKSCMKRCSCFFSSRICHPLKKQTQIRLFSFTWIKIQRKLDVFHSTFLVQSPGYTNCIPSAATLYETGITIYSSSFDPKDIGCILAHMPFTFSSYFVLFCRVFLLRCPPKKKGAAPFDSHLSVGTDPYSSFTKNIRAARSPLFAA